jgi:DNA-binding transcriptional LysR family regulator
MRYSLDEIETFLAVIEHGTLTAAGARLNLSKSVISKRISEFEAELGIALFRRNAGRIMATEAAMQLAERLRPALAALMAVTEGAGGGADGAAPLQGSLAIAAPMTFGTMRLSPILARFAAAHPGLDLRIEYDDRMRDLMREGFDIAIRIGDARDAHLMQRKLCEDRQIVCASPDYLARHGLPQTPADLSGHEVIGYTHMGNAQLWQFRQGGRLVSPPVRGRLTLNNGEAIRDMAIAGLGVAVLPAFVVSDALRQGQLSPLLAGFEARMLPVLAVWPPISPLPAKLRALIDHLAAELGPVPPWANTGLA